MLKPDQLVSIAEPVVAIYSQVEEDIAADIARRVVKTGYFTTTAQWQLEKARAFGYFRDHVTETLAKATGKTEKEVQKLMFEAGAQSLAHDDAMHRKAGLKFLPVAESPAMRALLLHGTDSTLRLINNFTKTTAQMSTIAYINSLDRAYIQIISGAFDANTAIKRAINDLAKLGLDKIAYPSETTTSLEASVRRSVTTGINQTVSKLQLERAAEVGCELVETSSHAGARPSHAVWQGQVFCIKGHHPRYGDFYRETGYGTGEGLCGWNCYHSFYPYYEGLSTPSFDRDPSKEAGRDNLDDYELQQKQRYYERQVRDAKKECAVINAAMEATKNEQLKEELYAAFQSSSVKLKSREAKLEQFIRKSGKTKDDARTVTANWNRSISMRAVWANKKAKSAR